MANIIEEKKVKIILALDQAKGPAPIGLSLIHISEPTRPY